MLEQQAAVGQRTTGRLGLRRALGVWAAAAFVVTNMVGTGIFTVPAFVRTATGSGVATLGVWALGGLIALSGALCYAELATRMPDAGGEYQYLSHIYGKLWGFVSGWISFFVGFSAAIAASALAAASYAAQVFGWNAQAPLFGGTRITLGSVAAALLIAALAYFHSTGIRHSGGLQTTIAALVVGAIVLMVFAGFATGRGNWQGIAQKSPATGLWWVSLIQVSFAYSGWNAASYLAGEVKDPRHTLPRALVGGTLIVTLIYLGLNVLFLYAIPADAWKADVAIGKQAAEILFGGAGATFVSVIITLTILGSVSAMTTAGPRVYYAMAGDGLAPAILRRLGRQSGAPTVSILAQSIVAVLLVLTGEFGNLLTYIGSALSLMAALTVAGVWIVSRRQKTNGPNIFRTPGYPVTPALFLLVEVTVFIQGLKTNFWPTFAALLTIGFGVIVFYVSRAFGWLEDET
ncbi:MAG TPA: amino acid permease, partial [Blastocatellia bacterium]|nr:amino acid permease [Blastocatellia bacterium]